jgi:hypothetical protein
MATIWVRTQGNPTQKLYDLLCSILAMLTERSDERGNLCWSIGNDEAEITLLEPLRRTYTPEEFRRWLNRRAPGEPQRELPASEHALRQEKEMLKQCVRHLNCVLGQLIAKAEDVPAMFGAVEAARMARASANQMVTSYGEQT